MNQEEQRKKKETRRKRETANSSASGARMPSIGAIKTSDMSFISIRKQKQHLNKIQIII
jgi:hypothetical protein